MFWRVINTHTYGVQSKSYLFRVSCQTDFMHNAYWQTQLSDLARCVDNVWCLLCGRYCRASRTQTQLCVTRLSSRSACVVCAALTLQESALYFFSRWLSLHKCHLYFVIFYTCVLHVLMGDRHTIPSRLQHCSEQVSPFPSVICSTEIWCCYCWLIVNCRCELLSILM